MDASPDTGRRRPADIVGKFPRRTSQRALDAIGQRRVAAVEHGGEEVDDQVGRAVAALAHDPDVSRWNGKSLSSGQLAKVYGFTDLDGSRPDAWRYVLEVQDAGKPADVTGYR
jgi:hypothetical protein